MLLAKPLWRRFADAHPEYLARHCRGKQIALVDEYRCFAGFYRVCVFELGA